MMENNNSEKFQIHLTLPIQIKPTDNGGYVIVDADDSEYFFYKDKKSGELLYDGCCVAVQKAKIVFDHLNLKK